MRVDSFWGLIACFSVVAVICTAIESRYSLPSRHSYANRASDWWYWPVSALLIGNLTRGFVFGVAMWVAGTLQSETPLPDAVQWIHSVVPGSLEYWPAPLQFVLALGVGDFVGYWSHRLRHTPGLWRFHAIHHAPRRLDWLSAVRMHPVDDAIDNVAVGLTLLFLGIDFEVWALVGPFLLFFNAWLHLNVDWDLGKLLASPRFHRRHHALGENANFAGIFPLWDVVFGTYDVRTAQVLGVKEDVPDGILAGWWWPMTTVFRRHRGP